MKKKYIWILVAAITVLIVPTVIYLCFLIPQMKEEYIVLMSSSGVIGGGGLYGASAIPDKVKYSGLFKMSARAFTLLTVTTLVEKFILQLVGLVATIVVSYVIYKILMEVYRDRKQARQNYDLASKIARSIGEASE